MSRAHQSTSAVRFLDSLSVGKPTNDLPMNSNSANSTLLAAKMAVKHGNGAVAAPSGFLDAKGERVAQSYGVERLLKNEELAARGKPHLPTPSSGWRKTTELEQRLMDAEREKAAAKLQVEQLRAENRRKGNRITQLEKLISLLEEHNRSLDGRLRSLDSDPSGRVREPLPAHAANELDTSVATALMHSRAARLRRHGGAWRRVRRPQRAADGAGDDFISWAGEEAAEEAGGLGGAAAANGGGGPSDTLVDDGYEVDEEADFLAMEAAAAAAEDEEAALDDDTAAAYASWRGGGGGGGGGGAGGPKALLVWRAHRWVDSLGVSSLVADCLLRHLRAKSSAATAELPFVGSLGEVASRVTMLAALREGACLEKLATALHTAAGRVANERRAHTGTMGTPLVDAIHPLRLHRLLHRTADIAPSPPPHAWLSRTSRKAEMEVSGRGGGAEALMAAAVGAEPGAVASADPVHAIMLEHTVREDANVRFDSPELSTPTFPACEYWFVADPMSGLRTLQLQEWPGAHVALPSRGQTPKQRRAEVAKSRALARKPRPWAALEPSIRMMNDRLAACGTAPLTLAEGLACRLATGPMTLKYDALLKYAAAPTADAKRVCDELCLGNGYQATLSALLHGLRRLAKLGTGSTPLYRCVSAETAAGVWTGAARSGATASSGLLTCVLDRSAALAAAAKAAAYPVPAADVHAYAGDAEMERAAVSKRQYWAAYRGELDEIRRLSRSGDDDDLASAATAVAEPDDMLPHMPAGVVDRSSAGGRDGAALVRIDPVGADGALYADLNFLSQRPMAECREVTLVPLTPVQITSCHVEGSVLVLHAIGGRAAELAAKLPTPHSHPPSSSDFAHGAATAAAAAAAAAAAPGHELMSSAMASSATRGEPPLMTHPIAAGPPPVAPSPSRPRARDVAEPLVIQTVGSATPLASVLPAAPLSLVHSIDGIVQPTARDALGRPLTRGPADRLRKADALQESMFRGCPFVASRVPDVPSRCYLWYHLPRARGGVEMRYRRVGERDWTAHETAVQVLPGGWWRTGAWMHAGDLGYEQSCWVDGECIMAGILGPSLTHILDALPEGTAPPSPNGIGSDGKGVVNVRNGRIVSKAEAAEDAQREAETAADRVGALTDILGRPATPAAAGATPKVGKSPFAAYVEQENIGVAAQLGPPATPKSARGAGGAPPTPANAASGVKSASQVAVGDGGLGKPPPVTDESNLARDEIEWVGDGGMRFGAPPPPPLRGNSLLVRQMWHAANAADERALENAKLTITRMTWNGLHYVRIWSLRAPARGASGGGFDLPVEAIEMLAADAQTIHIRVRGDETSGITLRPGVEWPLQQLRRGLPFDTTLHGVDVTPAIARVTWTSPSNDALVDAMWTKGSSRRKEGNTLRDGRLYLGAGNPHGLNLIAGSRCEMHSGVPVAVEVWLGRVLT